MYGVHTFDTSSRFPVPLIYVAQEGTQTTTPIPSPPHPPSAYVTLREKKGTVKLLLAAGDLKRTSPIHCR